MGSDAPGIDGYTVIDEGFDDFLGKVIGDTDRCILKSGLVEAFPDHAGQVGKVTGVNSDPDLKTLCLLLKTDFDCGINSASQRVVGVNQKYRIVRIDRCELPESLFLAVKAHDPGVGHGTCNGNAVFLSGIGVACYLGASYERCT